MKERYMKDLLDIRKDIDKIDEQIVKLYEERMKLTSDVAEYKINTGKQIFDKEREESKLATLQKKAESDFTRHGIRELFEQIMAMSRKKQYKLLTEHGIMPPQEFELIHTLDYSNARIVFQGLEGAYSQLAMEQFFGENCNNFHVESWKDAMEEDADERDIRTVYSHKQSLMQCSEFLDSHADWEKFSVSNNAVAAKKVKEDGEISQAAIASAKNAQIYGLKVLRNSIQNNKNNSTRFIVVTGKKVYTDQADRISICFEINHESGALYHALSHFIYNGLNMTNIQSRPLQNKNWEYRFFVDFEGRFEDHAVQNALRGLREETIAFRILGTY